MSKMTPEEIETYGGELTDGMIDVPPVKKPEPENKPAAPKKPKKVEAQLLTAMKFIKPAVLKKGEDEHTYVRLHNGYAVGFNRTLAAGYPILETELSICAHADTLTNALKDFTDGDTVTQVDVNTLQLTVGDLAIDIPSLAVSGFQPVAEDPNVGAVDDNLKAGFKILEKLIKASGDSIMVSSLKLGAGVMSVCDKEMFIQFHHGCVVPPVILPKVFVAAVAKVKQPIVGVGLGQHSFTIHFENGAWIRSQFWQDGWPEESDIFPPKAPENMQDVPDNFFARLKKHLPFCDTSRVYFGPGWMGSKPTKDEGARVAVKGLEGPDEFVALNGKSVMFLSGEIDRMIIDKDRPSLFYGERMRAAIYPIKDA